MSASDFEGYSLRLADKHGQPRSMLAASLEKASFLASSPSDRVHLKYTRDFLLELSTKKECTVCPAEVPAALCKDNQGAGILPKEGDGLLIQKGARTIPGKGIDSEGRLPQENGPSSWHNERDRDAWRHIGRPRSFEDEALHNGARGPLRGPDRWDKERGEKELGPGAPRGNGPRENHRPLNPPGFGGGRWGEGRPGPAGRFRDERERDGYTGPGRFRDEGGRGPGSHGPPGPSRPQWDHPTGRDRGPPGAGPDRPGPGYDRRGPSDERRGGPARPSGGGGWEDDNYKDDETFGFDDPKQLTGTEKEEEERKRRAQFEKEFEEMRKARHKKPEAPPEGDTPSKKHDEDGIWDTNLSFEESSTTTTVTAGGQVNRRTVTSTVTGLRAPPGFGPGGFRKGEEGPVTPRTPRASDGDWRINKRVVVEETVEPAKGKTPVKAAPEGGAMPQSEGSGSPATGTPSLLDSIFASGDKGGNPTKEEGGVPKTGESLVLENLFKNAHRKVFPGLPDDDPVTEAVLSDRWADAVEAEEADAKASKFARWFNKTEEMKPANPQSSVTEKEDNVLASSALMSMLQKPGAPMQKSAEGAVVQPASANPLDRLFPTLGGSTASQAMPAGPSLAEIEQAMQSEAGGGGIIVSTTAVNKDARPVEDLKGAPKPKAEATPERVKSPEPKLRTARVGGGVAVKGLRDLVENSKKREKASVNAREDGLAGKHSGGLPKEVVTGALNDSGGDEIGNLDAAKAQQVPDGDALFVGAKTSALGPPPGDMLASIFGAGPAGLPGKKATAPVFMTLEDIEKSMLEEVGKGGGVDIAKPPVAPAMLKPSGQADVVASMHLLSLLKKQPQSGQQSGEGGLEGGGAKKEGAELESKGKAGVNGPVLDNGDWTLPESESSLGGSKLAAIFGRTRGALEMEEAGKDEGLPRTGVDGRPRPEEREGLDESLKDEAEMVGDLLMYRHLAASVTGSSRFLKHALEGQLEAPPSEFHPQGPSILSGPEGGGWPRGPPGPFYGAQQGQQQLPPRAMPPQVMQHSHQQHQQLPPHLWPYGANGALFGPGPPSGSLYGGDHGPYSAMERQLQPLERQNSGSSNGFTQGGPFAHQQGNVGNIPGPLPPYAFDLRGLVHLPGPQGAPPQFANVNGPPPGAYMRPVFNMPYLPDGLHGGGGLPAMYGLPGSQSGRSSEQQTSHRPPPSQFLGGPYGSDFWGGGQPGGEGMPSAAR